MANFQQLSAHDTVMVGHSNGGVMGYYRFMFLFIFTTGVPLLQYLVVEELDECLNWS